MTRKRAAFFNSAADVQQSSHLVYLFVHVCMSLSHPLCQHGTSPDNEALALEEVEARHQQTGSPSDLNCSLTRKDTDLPCEGMFHTLIVVYIDTIRKGNCTGYLYFPFMSSANIHLHKVTFYKIEKLRIKKDF